MYEKHYEESMKSIKEIDDLDAIIETNAKDLEEKKKVFNQKKEGIAKASEELSNSNVLILSMIDTVSKGEIKEETVLDFVQGSDPLHDKWVKKESKKSAYEECIMQLKKTFEDKLIPLHVLLENTRKLSEKQFMCIYMMSVIERCLKKAVLSK